MFIRLMKKVAAMVLVAGGVSLPAVVMAEAPQSGLAIETVDSKSVDIVRSYIETKAGKTLLRGELMRGIPGRGPMPGHLHVELLSPEGKVLKEANVEVDRKSYLSRTAEFSVELPKPLAAGEHIRVTHHDAESHPLETPDSEWRDVIPNEPN